MDSMKSYLSLIFAITLLFSSILSGCGDTTNSVTPEDLPAISASIIRVPGNARTIQEAIDNADDLDTILVADGIYTGSGNYDIDFDSKSLILLSENGPAFTIIDCNGSADEFHSGLTISGRIDHAVVDGFTIKNGYTNSGAGIFISGCSPAIRNCVIANNYATVSGGGIRCKGADPTITNCTFVDNSSMAGGALFVIASSSPLLLNCIIAFSGEGGGVYSSESSSQPSLICCDLYSNLDGNWAGNIIDQSGLNGNFEADPDFCDREVVDFSLSESSPCAPANSNCGVTIGALGTGCN